jgi:hypothetical protein
MDTNEDEDEKDDEAQKKAAAEFQYQAWLKWLFSGHEIALEILKAERANTP